MVKLIYLVFSLFILPLSLMAEETIELETTVIKGNKESPQVLYVVPWKDHKESHKAERNLVLHSLYGNLFKPVLPKHKN